MSKQKPKIIAIRSTPEQTVLLKATFSVSSNPSPAVITELSQRTGLPVRWINNWFSRQRSKSRKLGEIIDITGATPVIKVEEDNLDVSMADRSSSPPMPNPQIVSEKAEPVKASRKRPPRKSKAKKKSEPTVKKESQEAFLSAAAASNSASRRRQPPQLLPSVTVSSRVQTRQTRQTPMQPPLPIPLPTRSTMALRPQENSIYSQDTTEKPESVTLCEDIRPTSYRRQNRPIMRNDFRHSVPSNYYSDPVFAKATSPYQKDPEINSHRASSPIQYPEYASSNFVPAYTHSTMASTAGPSIVQPAALDQQLLLDLHLQTLAGYAGLYQNYPAVHRAMLLNYAALLPTLSTASAGALAVSGSIPSSNNPTISIPVSVDCSIGGNALTDISPRLPSFSPKYPSLNLEVPSELSGYPPLAMAPEAPGTRWNTSSDFLDFSSLNYDCAPLIHLQERLESFRLPESTYLFGREGVVNHLLDERLAVEEPFQAAMGLVLLSKLGLKW